MNARDENELVTISHELLAAIQTRDAAALDRLTLDDFVHINEAGTRQPKADFISAIQTGAYQIERLTFESLSVDRFANVGVVSGVQRAVVILNASERVEGRTAFTDVFLRGRVVSRRGRWRPPPASSSAPR